MNAATVDDLLARERRGDRTALVDATGREYDRHWLCTSSWKAGNFLRHSGVREDVTVGVAGEGPLALLAFFGTTLLEGTTRFDPPTDLAETDAFRALVVPTEDGDAYELPPGAQRVYYGDQPDQPGIHHFEAGLWSENPSFPPLSVDPETALVTDSERTLTHGEALEAARGVVDDHGLDPDDRVVVRAPLSELGTVIAGVLAPLLIEAPIVLTDGEDATEARGAVAVGSDPVPEPARIGVDVLED
ncbi:acyl-CoA synthetase family protein [Natronococcus occultus]|uniref:Acyl-CoA synthetase (AMP-forming)/AMP-acid ligase II n=1 Tax=Natronococcus occultus SP4 TaxID=694430 RepID=L0K4Z1_9EURY|nr:hypothetical protein [Natronococcus occultus]AGB39429.1 hypothetical protein Natoc_3714 [Natronococcus occultus SP4]